MKYRVLILSILFISLYSGALIAFADPALFHPSDQETDPGCAPGSAGCYVNNPDASGSTDGILTAADWTTFNNKLTTVSVDGVTITGDGTPGDPLVAVGGGSSLLGSTSSFASETWLGNGAGGSGASAINTVFLGINAGAAATGASDSNFIGNNTGVGATNASYSNFFGSTAGYGAINAEQGNFIGFEAGYSATDAIGANFLGSQSGKDATNASGSNFIGDAAGEGATNANLSNFLGNATGQHATNAFESTFIGNSSGRYALNSSYSFFVGYHAGASDGVSVGSQNANNSIFIGNNAGYTTADFSLNNSTAGYTSILIGDDTSTGGFSNSIAIGKSATNTMSDQFLVAPSYVNWQIAGVDYIWPGSQGSSSTMLVNDGLGNLAWTAIPSGGTGFTINAYNSMYAGTGAGSSLTTGLNNFFAGVGAGYTVSTSKNNTFIGYNAGYLTSTDSTGQNSFFGSVAGYNNTGSNNTFLGQASGYGNSTGSSNTFLGQASGYSSNTGSNNTAVGLSSGFSNTSGSYLVMLGAQANVNTDGLTYSTVIGYNARLAHSNSIALGASAVTTAANQFMIGNTAHGIESTVIQGASSSCTITTGTGIACSSDERLKTNITDLSTDVLDNLLKLRTVTYNWTAQPDEQKMIGFLAQDLEQYYPELVSTGADGYKSVYYSQITPVLVEAIRELNVKIDSISGLGNQSSSTFDVFRNWLADAGNGIISLFVHEVHTDKLCVGTTCVTEAQLQQLLQNQNTDSQQNTIFNVDTALPTLDASSSDVDTTASTTDTISPDTDITPPVVDTTTPAADTISN